MQYSRARHGTVQYTYFSVSITMELKYQMERYHFGNPFNRGI